MDRDREILNWVNAVGFANIEQIMRRFKLKQAPAYRRVKKILEAKYLNHRYVFHGEKGVYTVTAKGRLLCGSELPHLKKIQIGSYYHDLKMISLSLDLIEKYGCEFLSDRQLRHQYGTGIVGRRGHIPDGVLVFDDEKQIAIELELTKKGALLQKNLVLLLCA